MFKFGSSSKEKLKDCDESIQLLMNKALELSEYDFGISCGMRAIKEQQALFDSGASQTMSSRHLPNAFGESEAADIVIYVNGVATWDSKYYRKVSGAIFQAAFELGIAIEWGGHWETLNDMPHYQLSYK